MIVFLCLLALAAAKPQVHATTDGDNAEFIHSINDFIPQEDINHEIQNIDDHVIQPRSCCFPIYSCENMNTINTENIPKQSYSYNDITNLRQDQNSPANMLHYQTVHQHCNPIPQIQQQCLQQHQIEILQKEYQTQLLRLKTCYENALNQALCQPQTCVQTEFIPPPNILSSTQWTTPLQNIDISSSEMNDQPKTEPTDSVNTEFISGTCLNVGSCQVHPFYAITCFGKA